MTAQTVHLDFKPRPWQQECHRARKRFTVLAIHRRAGKTELAIMELLDEAMRCTRELGRYAYVAPLLKQSKTVVWARLKRKIEPLRRHGDRVLTVNESELSVTFAHNGASVRLFGADNYDALRGMGLDGVVIDEVADIEPDAWESVIRKTLADRRGWALFIGTPKGVNLFSELYYRAQDPKHAAEWHAAKYTVYETNALDPAEVESDRKTSPDNVFAREYLCDFAAAGDNQLISLTDVELAAKRAYVPRDVDGLPRIMGVDPARFGDDRSVIVKRQGLQMFDPLVFRGLDNMELAARVANVITEWKPHATFIDSGAGAGVIDRLRQLHYEVTEVPFGGKATLPHLFLNRRSEMWWAIKEWLASGGAIPNDRVLKQELATPIYWFDNAGRKVLESKDEIKKRLFEAGSPDIADALALTFAHPVHAPDVVEVLGQIMQRQGIGGQKPYNEYADL